MRTRSKDLSRAVGVVYSAKNVPGIYIDSNLVLDRHDCLTEHEESGEEDEFKFP